MTRSRSWPTGWRRCSRSTVTDAVRVALEHRLKELEDEREERGAEIDAILAEFDAEP